MELFTTSIVIVVMVSLLAAVLWQHKRIKDYENTLILLALGEVDVRDIVYLPDEDE